MFDPYKINGFEQFFGIRGKLRGMGALNAFYNT